MSSVHLILCDSGISCTCFAESNRKTAASRWVVHTRLQDDVLIEAKPQTKQHPHTPKHATALRCLVVDRQLCHQPSPNIKVLRFIPHFLHQNSSTRSGRQSITTFFTKTTWMRILGKQMRYINGEVLQVILFCCEQQLPFWRKRIDRKKCWHLCESTNNPEDCSCSHTSHGHYIFAKIYSSRGEAKPTHNCQLYLLDVLNITPSISIHMARYQTFICSKGQPQKKNSNYLPQSHCHSTNRNYYRKLLWKQSNKAFRPLPHIIQPAWLDHFLFLFKSTKQEKHRIKK